MGCHQTISIEAQKATQSTNPNHWPGPIFLHPPLDSQWKGHRLFYTTSLMPVPYQQVLMVNQFSHQFSPVTSCFNSETLFIMFISIYRKTSSDNKLVKNNL